MKILNYVPLLLALTVCQCKPKTGVKAGTKAVVKEAEAAKESWDNTLVTQPCAIVVQPSGRLIDKVRKENTTEDGYNTVVDDNVWYMGESRRYLDSVKIKQVQRESEGSVKFRTASGEIYTMKLDTLFFGVILFNGKDKPFNADITDMESEYEKYMKKK